MEPLVAVLIVLVTIAILFEVARHLGVPYPALFVLGGLLLGLVPGIPHPTLEPELVLLVFLPPLLFGAATEMPIRELRANLAPIVRLAFGLVLFTMVAVAIVAQVAVPEFGWAAAFTLGAIVAPTDPLAATSVFRRIGAPRIVQTLIEGEALFNDATALVAYRAAVAAVASGSFVLAGALLGFGVAVVGGVALGLFVGWLSAEILRRLDEPPVEVAVGFVVPFAAFLPAEGLGLSGVLAAVTAGLVIGSRLGRILTARSRVLWLSSWQMIGFIVNGFVFVLIGAELPAILEAIRGRPLSEIVTVVGLVCAVVIGTRFIWVFAASRLPNSPRQIVARQDPVLAQRLTFIVGWSGLRGAVSLAAALALPANFPERGLILLVTFAVIVLTLVGQGLTLPLLVRRAGWHGIETGGDEDRVARAAAYEAGLAEIERARGDWPAHGPLLDRYESGLLDGTQHLATEDAEETAERTQERVEHQQIQQRIIAVQRAAVIDLRDGGVINDETLRRIERDLDFEELRMEG